MPLIVSFDQSKAVLNGKNYRFAPGIYNCSGCALCGGFLCPGTEAGHCTWHYRRDHRTGVWKLEKTHSFSAPSFGKKK